MMNRDPKRFSLDLGVAPSLLAPKFSEIDDDWVTQSEICDVPIPISVSEFDSELVDDRLRVHNSLMRSQHAKPQFVSFRSETLDPFLGSSPHSSKHLFLSSLTEAQNLNLLMRSRITSLKEEMFTQALLCDAPAMDIEEKTLKGRSISEHLSNSENLSRRIRFLLTMLKLQMGDYPIQEALGLGEMSATGETSVAGEASVVGEASMAVEMLKAEEDDSKCGEEMLKLLLPRFFELVRSFPLNFVGLFEFCEMMRMLSCSVDYCVGVGLFGFCEMMRM